MRLKRLFRWLDFLCIDFFHNEGNGPPVEDLKTEQHQSLLLIPVYYDRDNFLFDARGGTTLTSISSDAKETKIMFTFRNIQDLIQQPLEVEQVQSQEV